VRRPSGASGHWAGSPLQGSARSVPQPGCLCLRVFIQCLSQRTAGPDTSERPDGDGADQRQASDEDRDPRVGLTGLGDGGEDPPAEQPVLVAAGHQPGEGFGEHEQCSQDRHKGGRVGERAVVSFGMTTVVSHGLGDSVGVQARSPFVGLTLSVRFCTYYVQLTYL